MSYQKNMKPSLANKTLRFACAAALSFAPMMGAAQAKVKVGVTAAVIPQAVMGANASKLKTITVGTNVDQDVLIETGARGRTQVLFVDGSSMNIGPSSRIIIDEFVFDPGQLDGNLQAKVEKGSMRFIGGILSKRAGQVEFNAGEATVGIRGGIAKVAVEPNGNVLAQLVHGQLSVQTPEGVYETDRIGTQIERAPDGAVATSTVTAADSKTELDQEAEENEQETAPEETTAATNEAGGPSPTQEGTGDVLTENPVESGLVEVDAQGNLKASDELVAIDPDAAKLIDEGALVVTADGGVAPTAKILDLDPIAQKMFEEGLLKVDENGLLVPNEDFSENAFFDSNAFVETDDKTVSDETLADFGLSAPTELTQEDTYKSNLLMTRLTLKSDAQTAKLLEVGQLEIDGESGLLKPSQNFNPLIVARAEKATSQFSRDIVKDDIADRMLLSAGAFDTKVTTRVVGLDLAGALYSEPVVSLVKRDIVRDDALNAIERLAGANDVFVPEDIKQRSLTELVTIGGALSTRDALKASINTKEAEFFLPEINIGEKGAEEVVTLSITPEAAVAFNLPKDETDLTSDMFASLLARGIDASFVTGFINGDEESSLSGGINTIGNTGNFDDGAKQDDAISVDEKVETESFDGGAIFTDPATIGSDGKTDDYGIDVGNGVEGFVSGLGGEFGANDDDLLASIGISTGIGWEDGTPKLVVPGISTGLGDDDLGSTATEDAKEAATEAIQDKNERARATEYYHLSVAGQNLAINGSSFGDDADYWWTAYGSNGVSSNTLIHSSDDSVTISMDATGQDASGRYSVNLSAVDKDTLGKVTDILGQHSASFTLALAATYLHGGLSRGFDDDSGTASLQTNDLATLQRSSPYELCTSCDQVATGIWKSWGTDARTSPGRQHQGHWAIGSPLDGDTIDQLTGRVATFSGGVYGTASANNNGRSETGFGQFSARLDFNNPTSAENNYWQLESFRGDSFELRDKVTVPVTHGSEAGRYAGFNNGSTVDGGVHGTIDNLQTAGTFAINTTDDDSNKYAITGSYAGTGSAY